MSNEPLPESTPACSQCGAVWRSGAKFCTSCGAPLATKPTAHSEHASRPKAATRNQRQGRWLLLATALLIAGVVAIFALINREPQTAPSTPVAIPTAPVASRDIPFPDVTRVTVEDAHIMAMSGDAVIVDVRDKPFYEASHIRGALSLSLSELPARFRELPKDKAILTYCT